MTNREQKVIELMEGFRSLRGQGKVFAAGKAGLPRITPSQWEALAVIEGAGESTVKEVAGALGVTSSAATQLIEGLVQSGYVVRRPDKADRRVVLLLLSKKSKAQVERIKKQMVQKFLTLFEVLTDKEFGEYLRLNKKIVERFSNK